MTTASQRTLAVIQARDLLVELSRDCKLPNEIRREAQRLLRHYPSKSDLDVASRLEGQNPLRVEPVFESPGDASVN